MSALLNPKARLFTILIASIVMVSVQGCSDGFFPLVPAGPNPNPPVPQTSCNAAVSMQVAFVEDPATNPLDTNPFVFMTTDSAFDLGASNCPAFLPSSTLNRIVAVGRAPVADLFGVGVEGCGLLVGAATTIDATSLSFTLDETQALAHQQDPDCEVTVSMSDGLMEPAAVSGYAMTGTFDVVISHATDVNNCANLYNNLTAILDTGLAPFGPILEDLEDLVE